MAAVIVPTILSGAAVLNHRLAAWVVHVDLKGNAVRGDCIMLTPNHEEDPDGVLLVGRDLIADRSFRDKNLEMVSRRWASEKSMGGGWGTV